TPSASSILSSPPNKRVKALVLASASATASSARTVAKFSAGTMKPKAAALSSSAFLRLRKRRWPPRRKRPDDECHRHAAPRRFHPRHRRRALGQRLRPRRPRAPRLQRHSGLFRRRWP